MRIKRFLSTQAAEFKSFGRPAQWFLLSTILGGVVFSGWSLFFNFYILERGFGRDFLGMVNAAPSVAALLLGIAMGQLSDRMGRKPAMLIGMTLFVICSALTVTLLNPTLILAAAFFGGVANSLYYLSHAPLMMKISNRKNRTLLFSLNYGLVTLSSAVGSLFAGQLPAVFGGWLGVAPRSAEAYQAVLLLSVFLSLFTLVPLMLIKIPASKEAAEETIRKRPLLKDVLFRPLTLKLSLPNLLIGFGAAILVPYMNVFFYEQHGVSDQALGVLFSVSAVMTGIGSVLSPRLAGGLGSKIRAVVLTQAASLFFLLLMGFSPFLGLVVLSFLMRGTLMNMAVPLYSAFAMEQVSEREQGTVNSIKELAWQVGWAVGPYISGVVQQSYGFTPLFITTGILYASAIVVTWLFFGKGDALPAFLELENEAPSAAIFEAPGD
jgi:MFS family permease